MSEKAYPEHPILLVDDEQETLKSLEYTLYSIGINNVLACSDPRRVPDMVKNRTIDIIILDIIMPYIGGLELLKMLNLEFPGILVIMATGVNDVDTAVQCMKQGAFDYILKPVDRNALVAAVRKAVERCELHRENERLKSYFLERADHDTPEAFAAIITRNARMRAIFQYCEVIAASRQPILIAGETGVGKELMARAIHKLRKDAGPLVTVNVSGLDDHMFADTLFGHTKGAFTGAAANRDGLIKKAEGGTLFLDEIGDLSLVSQVKLLRLLQEREYNPLGSDTVKTTDARFILATNRNLEEAIEKQEFRKDLYYRLNTHRIEIPSLRERPDDIPLLLNFFLEEAARELNRKPPAYPPELLTLLKTYSFPGNVREFRAMVYDAVSSHKSGIMSLSRFRDYISRHSQDSLQMPREPANGYQAAPFTDKTATLPTIKEATRMLIEEAMTRANGNQRIAAGMLGITQQALSSRLKTYRKSLGKD